MKDIRLNFTGYYRTNNLIPEKSGIYIAHAVKLSLDKKQVDQFVQLIYIGKAEGADTLKTRIQQHISGADVDRSNQEWGKSLKNADCDYDEIVYSCAVCDEKNLADIETALIYANENNGIFNDIDTHGHNNQDANNLNIMCFGKKGELQNHIIEIK